MQFAIDVGVGGWGLLVVGAFVIGVVAQWIGIAEGDDDWFPVMAGAFVGGAIGSEWIAPLAALEPVWDGIALVPAAIGGALVGAIAALIVLVTGGQTHSEGGGHA
jgi:hypothetical protein